MELGIEILDNSKELVRPWVMAMAFITIPFTLQNMSMEKTPKLFLLSFATSLASIACALIHRCCKDNISLGVAAYLL